MSDRKPLPVYNIIARALYNPALDKWYPVTELHIDERFHERVIWDQFQFSTEPVAQQMATLIGKVQVRKMDQFIMKAFTPSTSSGQVPK